MKNAFERRRAHRQLLQHARTEESRFVNILAIEARINAYEQAYRELYNENCKVQYKNGWYWVDKRKFRASKLEEMTKYLLASKHERDLNTPEEL